MSRSAAARSSATDLKASRELLIARAALERAAIRDATHDLQSIVDGADCAALLALVRNPRSKRAHMKAVQRCSADERHQVL